MPYLATCQYGGYGTILDKPPPSLHRQSVRHVFYFCWRNQDLRIQRWLFFQLFRSKYPDLCLLNRGISKPNCTFVGSAKHAMIDRLLVISRAKSNLDVSKSHLLIQAAVERYSFGRPSTLFPRRAASKNLLTFCRHVGRELSRNPGDDFIPRALSVIIIVQQTNKQLRQQQHQINQQS